MVKGATCLLPSFAVHSLAFTEGLTFSGYAIVAMSRPALVLWSVCSTEVRKRGCLHTDIKVATPTANTTTNERSRSVIL